MYTCVHVCVSVFVCVRSWLTIGGCEIDGHGEVNLGPKKT